MIITCLVELIWVADGRAAEGHLQYQLPGINKWVKSVNVQRSDN